ncbi:MAG: hypothetical protein ACREKM_07330, partial [Longimicrobiales bacterium]
MPDAVRAPDALVAGLLEQLARVAHPDEACSLVLEYAATGSGSERALLLVRTEGELRAVGRGLPGTCATEAIRVASEPGSPIAALLEALDAPRLLASGAPGVVDFPATVIPVPGVQSQLGIAFLETGDPAAPIGIAADVLRRSGPTLERSVNAGLAGARAARIARQRDILTEIINAISDPVILTNAQADVLLANRRAESLLTPGADDNEGRRHAIDVNNLLFSAFLTQAEIGASATRVDPSSRELNLVDTFDGSDLLL